MAGVDTDTGADNRAEVLRAEALAALQAANPRSIRAPLLYRLSLIPAALIILALPLVYLIIVAGVAWWVYWYPVHGYTFTLSEFSFWHFVARFGPPVAGSILVIFLLKPIFARPSKPTRPHSLTKDKHPFLFDFVRSLCQQVKAPVPHQINVSLEATPRRHLSSA